MNFSEEENFKTINKNLTEKGECPKSRSRSRTRSLSTKKKNKKSKKSKKSKKRKRSSSYSSKSSRSRDYSDFDRKLNNLRRETQKHKKERSDSPIKPNLKINLPNKGILANIIQDNIKINRKLDQGEIDRATKMLRQVDSNTNKKATLMSSFINSSIKLDSEDYTYENINGEMIKVHKDFICEIKVKLKLIIAISIFLEMWNEICIFK
jgi:hypothetical protein